LPNAQSLANTNRKLAKHASDLKLNFLIFKKKSTLP